MVVIAATVAFESMVTKHQSTPKERDERVKVDLPPEKLVEGVLQAVPHPDERERQGLRTASAPGIGYRGRQDAGRELWRSPANADTTVPT